VAAGDGRLDLVLAGEGLFEVLVPGLATGSG
jgi:hypothetical protein